MSSKKLTTEEYIKRARGIHGDEYDYSLVEFKNSSTKIKVICSVHNVFEVLPQSHANTNGKGAKCGKCRGFHKTKAEFVAQAKQIHGNKYNYSKVKYLGSDKKIEINCHKHGAFWQRASNHLLGRGCNDCGDEDRLKFKTKDLSDFIKQAKLAHKGLYKYEKVNYINSNTNVLITCKKHNDFTQLPSHHLRGSGCPKCGDEQVGIKSRITQEEFIKQSNIIHNNKYDYSKTKVQGSHKYLTVICPTHREWDVLQTNHLSGYGCPKCLHKAEGRICEYILKKNILIREFKIESKRYDFFLPDFNLIIERDGEQHYKDIQIRGAAIKVKAQQTNDRLKTKMAKDAGFKLARIPYWLTNKEEEIEIENILAGKPTYPDVPDLKQEKTRPKPKRQN
jgi:very-short-patch-repair endonuclease